MANNKKKMLTNEEKGDILCEKLNTKLTAIRQGTMLSFPDLITFAYDLLKARDHNYGVLRQFRQTGSIIVLSNAVFILRNVKELEKDG